MVIAVTAIGASVAMPGPVKSIDIARVRRLVTHPDHHEHDDRRCEHRYDGRLEDTCVLVDDLPVGAEQVAGERLWPALVLSSVIGAWPHTTNPTASRPPPANDRPYPPSCITLSAPTPGRCPPLLGKEILGMAADHSLSSMMWPYGRNDDLQRLQ
jgi:hypothetical protein